MSCQLPVILLLVKLDNLPLVSGTLLPQCPPASSLENPFILLPVLQQPALTDVPADSPAACDKGSMIFTAATAVPSGWALYSSALYFRLAPFLLL